MSGRRLLCLAALLQAACSDGQASIVGTAEPFSVRGAQFFEGALPGTPAEKSVFMDGDPPQIGLTLASSVVQRGFGGKKLSAHLTMNAVSAGFALKGLGTGWWMLPAGDPDTSTTPPSLSLTATADVGEGVPLGLNTILAVALDEAGRAGPQFEQSLCVSSAGPEGNSACPGGAPLPAAAITLTWDTQVDLDLEVMTPDGKLVSPKYPSVDDLGKGQTFDPTSPHIDRDSNANCVLDGVRSESLIWPTRTADQGETELPSGVYDVYVNLFDACGQRAVDFDLTITRAAAASDGGGGAGAEGDAVEQTLLSRTGEIIAVQSSETGPGLFVAEYDFE